MRKFLQVPGDVSVGVCSSLVVPRITEAAYESTILERCLDITTTTTTESVNQLWVKTKGFLDKMKSDFSLSPGECQSKA